MDKFTLQNVPSASYNRTMRELFIDLIDITMEETGRGCLKSVPTNFGYVFFWYGWLNKKALQNYYPAYVPKDKVKEIKKTKKQKDALPLQDQVSDFLFQIARDQPDILGEGHAETHLTILAPRLRQMAVADAARVLKEYAQKLERLDKFTRKYLKKKAGRIVEEIATSFESIDFITDGEVKKWGDEYFWDDECGYVELAKKRLGCEIQVRVHFDGADTLKQVVERIDKAVASIKPELDHLYRFGKPLWPSILNLHTLSRELSVL